MPPPMPPPMAPPASGYPIYRFQDPVSGAPVAEWWQRALALIIDWAIFAVPGVILIIAVSAATSTTQVDAVTGTTTKSANVGIATILYVAIFIAQVAYYIVLNGGEKGQTVGKMALGIATRDESGHGPIGYGRAAGRFGIIFVLALPCFIGTILDYLWPLWDPRRQAVHDKVVRSLVVAVR